MTTLLGHVLSARAFDRAGHVERRRRVRERIDALARRALSRSRYYGDSRGEPLRRALAGKSDDAFFAAFAALEPLRKPELASQFDALSTDPEITLERLASVDRDHPQGGATLRTRLDVYNVKKTSGTSGQLVYQVDTLRTQRIVTSLVVYRALFRTLRMAGELGAIVPMPRRSRLAVFVHRGNRSVYQGASAEGAPRWLRALLDVHVVGHEASLDAIVRELDRLSPDFVFGLPSRIEWLARAQTAGRLRIAPRLVFVGGETLHDELRDACLRAWPAARLVNTYGTTETKPIAVACPECSELHVCEDIVHLELLDGGGEPCADGAEASRVLATSLWNFTVPILRYVLDDRIVVLPDAGCEWRTRRIRVRGREPSVLWTQDRRDGSWRALDARLLKEVLMGIKALSGYRVVHDAPRALQLTTVVVDPAARDGAAREVRASVERFVADHGCDVRDVLDELDIRVVDADTWNREGDKLTSIRSTVAPPELGA